MRIRPLLNRPFKTLPQILLMRRVLNDRYPEPIKEPQISLLDRPVRAVIPSRHALDLLYALNLKDVRARGLAEQSHQHGVDAVGVDAAACVADRVGC